MQDMAVSLNRFQPLSCKNLCHLCRILNMRQPEWAQVNRIWCCVIPRYNKLLCGLSSKDSLTKLSITLIIESVSTLLIYLLRYVELLSLEGIGLFIDSLSFFVSLVLRFSYFFLLVLILRVETSSLTNFLLLYLCCGCWSV